MKNEIVHRVFDFIKVFPPFDMLDAASNWTIAQSSSVLYLSQGKTLFDIGDSPNNCFYIVNDGAIHLFQSDGTLVEECDEGDLLGLRPLIAQSPYLLKAVAHEETLVYCIPTHVFVPLMDNNPKVSRYIATNFAVGVGNKYYQKSTVLPLGESQHYLNDIIGMDSYTLPFYTSKETTIKDSARIMAEKKIGSLIICDSDLCPIGIVTDKDLRAKVVAGDIAKTEPVSYIMSSPVLCLKPQTSLAEMQIAMLKHKINHLVITQDGTDTQPIIGIVSKHDLVVIQSDNPASLIKGVQKADNIEKLKVLRDALNRITEKYVRNDVPMKFILEVTSEINDSIIQKVIELSEKKLDPGYFKQVDYAFLVLGSMARGEQLLMTDQDNAIIYRANSNFPDLKERLLVLAKEINDALNYIGFEYCPADMMASNPAYCLTLEEWQNKFYGWMYEPGEHEVMMCTIFFDYRNVYGDKTLTDTLSAYIFDHLDKQEVFLRDLAQNALANPAPLSFFRKFVVEKSGEHKDTFDIKLRAMMPLVDAARLFILQNRISGVNSTIERFQKLAEIDKNNSELLDFAAKSFETLLKTRTLHGFKNKDSGRYIKPDDMDKMDRVLLRNAFQPINDIQSIIKIRFVL